MSSLKTRQRKRRIDRISQNPFTALDPCDYCRDSRCPCTFVADFSIMACKECTRRGQPCVTTSLARLDKVADELIVKIKADEAEVEELLTKVEALRQRIRRNRVVQQQNNRRVDEQVQHWLADRDGLENLGLEEGDFDVAGVESPLMWSFPASSAPGVPVSGQGSEFARNPG